MTYDFIIRIFIAGLLGGAIGLEREYRAKEAGFRTHFLVGLGSGLFMILSAHGFSDVVINEATSGFGHRFHWCRLHHLPKACRARTDYSGWTLGRSSYRHGGRSRHVCRSLCRYHDGAGLP